MEEYTQIKEVTFSGKFRLVLSEEDLDRCRVLVIDVQLTRPPQSPYFSDRTFPPNGFLAAITFLNAGMVVERRDVEYEMQRFVFDANSDQQDIPTQVCFINATTRNLQILAAALGANLGGTSSQYIQDLTPTGLFPQVLQFKCYADTALTVNVSRLKYEECVDSLGIERRPSKPPPPPIPPRFPNGTPIPREVYSENEGPPESFEPFPGDEPPIQLPFGEECVIYRLLGTMFDINGPGTESQDVDASFLGIIDEITFRDYESGGFEFREWVVISGGPSNATSCEQGTPFILFTGISPASFFEIDSIEPE